MPRPRMGNTRINLLIQPVVLNHLKKLARYKGSTYSEEIRQACVQYIRAEAARLQAERQPEPKPNHEATA